MPRVVDKMLINDNTTTGNHKAIKMEYRTGFILGEELHDLQMFSESEEFRDKMQVLCDAHNEADAKYLAGLRELNSAMAKAIDTHLAAKP